MQKFKNPLSGEIKEEISRVFKFLAEQTDSNFVGDFANKIRHILDMNLQRERVQFFIQGDINRVEEYVQRVIDHFVRLSPDLNRLQIEKSDEAWESLSVRLLAWSYSFLTLKGYPPGERTKEDAITCKAEAEIQILNAYFPYDVEFDPWARVIVQNTCRKFIHGENRPSIVPEHSLVEIDAELTDVADPAAQAQVEKRIQRADLVDAINSLNEERRRVIEMFFFDELPPTEIASIMKKNIGAIYSLKFNALYDLKKILNSNRDNVNE